MQETLHWITLHVSYIVPNRPEAEQGGEQDQQRLKDTSDFDHHTRASPLSQSKPSMYPVGFTRGGVCDSLVKQPAASLKKNTDHI